MSRTALFVIDIQRALADSPGTEISHARRIRDAGASILDKVRANIDEAQSRGEAPGLEIIVVQHEETRDKGNLQLGTRAWQLVFPPHPSPHETLVSKNIRDTFESNPGLADELRARNVGTIVAFGIQSECCVLSTCKGALAADFRVVLLKGAHSTYDAEGKTAEEIEREVEEELRNEGAEVVDWNKWSKGWD
ncbi:Isochorismatase hydrolase [Macroventuria anomochaeta]|uniref:Isochorismatase hydrolase n=1 Tax=Macroventuria anomochaeta TaxID=301207 RepID=A0ACB6SFZ9_9PLEO|nr:Isochorismatase hydrolase [Macroventuria anomochaeta]KAF2633151.1 Isochorismatase hydrolase [Macroventuria anomochaeta]